MHRILNLQKMHLQIIVTLRNVDMMCSALTVGMQRASGSHAGAACSAHSKASSYREPVTRGLHHCKRGMVKEAPRQYVHSSSS